MNQSDEKRIVALVDGEHYRDVNLDALERLAGEGLRAVAVVFLGGTEKLREDPSRSYRGLPVYAGPGTADNLRKAIREHRPDMVVDLSDEPVLGYRERFRLISQSLALGVDYRGADFYFSPPPRPFLCDRPAIGVWGAGKRVGKTAVTGYMARHYRGSGTEVCVCTMGRGGPAEPELLENPCDLCDEFLRSKSREGSHAASDHFEDAMMGGAVTVGCRRCGGGMAGTPFYSNVPEGASIACSRGEELVIFEGSGAAVPPVGVDSVMLVASAAQPRENLLEYLGPFRLLLSDLLVVTMCEKFLVSVDDLWELKRDVFSINPEVKVVCVVFRPEPSGELKGKDVFLVTTAPIAAAEIQAEYLEKEYGARVTGLSTNLADRKGLKRDLESAVGADVLATELKAAGVDTVSEFAAGKGIEPVYLDNVPIPVSGELDKELDRLLSKTGKRFDLRQS